MLLRPQGLLTAAFTVRTIFQLFPGCLCFCSEHLWVNTQRTVRCRNGHTKGTARHWRLQAETVFGFTLDIITEACSRTIQNTGKANFKYADKILSDWKGQNIHHLEDVGTLDKHSAAKSAARSKTSSPKTNNRFHNFEQRQYDDDFYDNLEQQLLRKQKE